jgi:hypothetical protein
LHGEVALHGLFRDSSEFQSGKELTGEEVQYLAHLLLLGNRLGFLLVQCCDKSVEQVIDFLALHRFYQILARTQADGLLGKLKGAPGSEKDNLA